MKGKCAVCEGEASKSCICGNVSYCSKTCQRRHWAQHRGDCPPFRVSQVQGKGRGLVASRKIMFGEQILTEKPLLLINNGEQPNLLAWSNSVLALVRTLEVSDSEKFHDLADNTSLAQSPEFLYLAGVRGLSQESLRSLRIIRTNGINIDSEGRLT